MKKVIEFFKWVWYNDPVMIKAIEMLRQADPKTQRIAALKLLLALEKNSFEE